MCRGTLDIAGSRPSRAPACAIVFSDRLSTTAGASPRAVRSKFTTTTAAEPG
jgi:hypothetical protein